jgi:hypothetical protein
MTRTFLPLSGAVTFAILGYGANALAVDCFIDSVNGNDSNTGLTEDQALKSQTTFPSTCTVVKFKRGSQFNDKLNTGGFSSKITTFTNYGDSSKPLPRFVMPNTAGTTKTGIAVSSNTANVTIDGLYIANSHGDGSSSSFSSGVCVQIMGANSVMQNCEITSCDIGVMLSGAGSKFLSNYVHDLNTMIVDAAQDSGTYINSIGGAEGIFVSGSNSEVAYNSFINCSTTAAWTGGNCDGGATEVSVSSGGTMSGLRIHHNFAYNTCGFFEVSGKGTFSDAVFSYNVAVDSGWLMLLQVNETTMSNVQWVNNTVVQHKGSSNAGMVTTIYGGTGASGGPVSGVTLPPGQVSMTNNLIIFDGVSSFGDVIDKNISQTTNVVAKTNPGVVNISGLTAADFDLVEGATTVIDQGTSVAGLTLDYLNRSVPSGSATDVGAFEYGATPTTSTGGASWSTGGAASTGGNSPVVTGGSSTVLAGGSPSTGGSVPKTTGGSNPVTSGGAPSTGGSSVVAVVGGANGTGGANNPAVTGGGPASAGGASPITPGGGAQATGGIASTNGAQGGADNVAGAGNVGGAAVAATTSPVNTNAAVDQGACTCRVAGRTSQSTAAAGWFALLMLGWGIRRNRRSSRA